MLQGSFTMGFRIFETNEINFSKQNLLFVQLFRSFLQNLAQLEMFLQL